MVGYSGAFLLNEALRGLWFVLCKKYLIMDTVLMMT